MLRKSQLKIDGNLYRVRPINEISEPIEKINAIALLSQSPPPPRSSPKNIQNALNDDCLCAIFQNFNNLADFASISNVCKRFNAIALQVFPSKIRTFLIDIDELVIDNGNQVNFITLAQLWRFLYDFGSSITSLKFHSLYLERTPNAANLAIKLIEKYCKNLRCLDIEINAEQDQIPEAVHSIFSKLSMLSIKFPQSMPSHDFISACRNLNDLSVYTRQAEHMMTATKFPGLLNLKAYRAVFGPDFFEQNPQIEQLEVNEICWPSETIRFICDNLVNLKKFKLYAKTGNELEELVHLRQDTIIHLDGISVYYTDRILRFNNITQITLHEGWGNDRLEHYLARLARHLQNLEKMKITPKKLMPSAIIAKILQHATRLRQFHQGGKFPLHFNENDYYRLSAPVAKRANQIKLTVTYKYICLDRDGLPEKRLHQKMRIWNARPDLFVFICT